MIVRPELLAASYLAVVGTPLGPPEELDDAPYGLLAHDASDDPLFVYANRTAQRLFGYTRDEFVGLPSRLSADARAQADRSSFLEAVRRTGYATGYRGARLTKTGETFWIEDVTLWNLPGGGQAALIPRWSLT